MIVHSASPLHPFGVPLPRVAGEEPAGATLPGSPPAKRGEGRPPGPAEGRPEDRLRREGGSPWRGAATSARLTFAGALLLFALPALAAPISIPTAFGPVVGDEAGGMRVFKAIPYAAPPVGDLRWAPPRPPASWSAPRPAHAFGPFCPQAMNDDGSPNAGGAAGPTSEDCLTLNLWAPAGAQGRSGRAPVMVWLHGGANVLGGGSIGAYDGSAFARDGVVLVTLNYRLGPLGFFAHPALTAAAAPGEPLVAYGLMDQIAALEWVRDNIGRFGGDPANVTLFGESAGGGDTLALMVAPAARGLFAKAIVESGGGWTIPATLADRERQGAALARQAGAPEGATLAQLRALPASALIGKGGPFQFGPAVDGRLLPEPEVRAFAAGRAAAVPLIIGSNSWEASLMATFKLPKMAAIGLAPPALKAAYDGLPNADALAQAMFTDAIMGAPARWVAGQAAQGTRGPAFLYHFAYVPTQRRGAVPGAGHDTEIPFVFDSWDHLGALVKFLRLSDEDKAMTALVHGCWVAFAKTGDPACAGWPRYQRASDRLLWFGSPAPRVETAFRKRQYDAQEAALLPRLGVGK